MPSFIQASLKIAAAAVIVTATSFIVPPSTVVRNVATVVVTVEHRVVGDLDALTDWVSPDWYTAPHIVTDPSVTP